LFVGEIGFSRHLFFSGRGIIGFYGELNHKVLMNEAQVFVIQCLPHAFM
jgi:hypothetical protein